MGDVDGTLSADLCLDSEEGDLDDKNGPNTGEGEAGGDESALVKKGKEKKTRGKRSLQAVSRAFAWDCDASILLT